MGKSNSTSKLKALPSHYLSRRIGLHQCFPLHHPKTCQQHHRHKIDLVDFVSLIVQIIPCLHLAISSVSSLMADFRLFLSSRGKTAKRELEWESHVLMDPYRAGVEVGLAPKLTCFSSSAPHGIFSVSSLLRIRNKTVIFQ